MAFRGMLRGVLSAGAGVINETITAGAHDGFFTGWMDQDYNDEHLVSTQTGSVSSTALPNGAVMRGLWYQGGNYFTASDGQKNMLVVDAGTATTSWNVGRTLYVNGLSYVLTYELSTSSPGDGGHHFSFGPTTSLFTDGVTHDWRVE